MKEEYQSAAALDERSDFEKEEALLERLDQCLMQHVAAVTTGDGHPTIAELYKLAPLISTHEYLSERAFLTEELNALLRFQDPLEVVAVCAEVGNPIVEIFLEDCLEEGRAEERFPLINAAPPAQRTGKTPAQQFAKGRGSRNSQTR